MHNNTNSTDISQVSEAFGVAAVMYTFTQFSGIRLFTGFQLHGN